MESGMTRSISSHRSGGGLELGVESVCLLLHNLIAGGSARQWIHLLGRHVADGGRATIVAPPGPLTPMARAAGVETVEIDWEKRGSTIRAGRCAPSTAMTSRSSTGTTG